MRNVIIIGPPASGKLTIARRLAKANGYFLFDNHKSIDAVELLTADQVTTPKALRHAIRKGVFHAASGSNTATIFTMVYGHPMDDEIMKEYTDLLTNDTPPLIVHLHCTKEDSIKRCQDASRAGTSKITEPDCIEGLYAKFDIESDYRPASADVLHINTSTCSVEDSVRAIQERI